MSYPVLAQVYRSAKAATELIAANSDKTQIDLSGGRVMRLGVVGVALSILFLRMPTNFILPQFWGEDGPVFYQQAVDHGWHSIFLPAAGYFTLLQRLIAVFANYFSPVFAPTILNFSAFAFTLFIVWLATSPRFDIPFRPLIALAIVTVPMGFEVLGTAANTQWIAPIAVFIHLFLRPHPSRSILICEVMFVAMIAFTGPCAIFLTPLGAALALMEPDRRARGRLLLLTGALTLGFLVTGTYLIAHRQEALNAPGFFPSMASTTGAWITLPLSKVFETFGSAVADLFSSYIGTALATIVTLLVGAFALRQPYRTLKISMLFLAVSVMLSGMIKYRASLPFITDPRSTRYFYAASVYFLWFICCAPRGGQARMVCASVVALAELFCVFNTRDTPRNLIDFEWPVWASFMSSGLPLIIPTTPESWYISEPTGNGRLSNFSTWIGSPLASKVSIRDADGCVGSFDNAEPFKTHDEARLLWVNGQGWDTVLNKPFQLVAVVDANDRILGFGLPGFTGPNEARSGWKGIIPTPEQAMSAYGLAEGGQRACLLGSANTQTAGEFAGGVPLKAGGRIVQRFKPSHGGIRMIKVAAVTWARSVTPYKVGWEIAAVSSGIRSEIGSGTIQTDNIKDWQMLELPISGVETSQPDEIELIFTIDADQPTEVPMGLPTFRSEPLDNANSLVIDGFVPIEQRVIGLKIFYGKF